jgi:hypothetical protein
VATIGIGCVLQWTRDYLERRTFDFEKVSLGSA